MDALLDSYAKKLYAVYKAMLESHPDGPTVLPSWDDLPPAIRDGWREVAVAAETLY